MFVHLTLLGRGWGQRVGHGTALEMQATIGVSPVCTSQEALSAAWRRGDWHGIKWGARGSGKGLRRTRFCSVLQ
jgi:hypothetical protein